jgi:hypothetical protein
MELLEVAFHVQFILTDQILAGNLSRMANYA